MILKYTLNINKALAKFRSISKMPNKNHSQ